MRCFIKIKTHRAFVKSSFLVEVRFIRVLIMPFASSLNESISSGNDNHQKIDKDIQILGLCRHFKSKGEPLSAKMITMICMIKTHRVSMIFRSLFSAISIASMIKFVSNILEETLSLEMITMRRRTNYHREVSYIRTAFL